MPSASEIMTLQSIAERHGSGILDIVLKQLNGIVHQGVWRNSMGELVYTKDVDIDSIYHTVLDIFMGDYALFCMETSEDGADIALSNDFDRQAIAAVAKIRQLLPIYRVEHRERCQEISDFLKECRNDYWLETGGDL